LPGFEALKVYGELERPVVDLLELLNSLDEFDVFYEFLLDDLQKESVTVLAMLADGYNRYHYERKVEAYREVRSAVSRIQSRIMLLNGLGVFGNDRTDKLCRDFEGQVKHLNALIKNMEAGESSESSTAENQKSRNQSTGGSEVLSDEQLGKLETLSEIL